MRSDLLERLSQSGLKPSVTVSGGYTELPRPSLSTRLCLSYVSLHLHPFDTKQADRGSVLTRLYTHAHETTPVFLVYCRFA